MRDPFFRISRTMCALSTPLLNPSLLLISLCALSALNFSAVRLSHIFIQTSEMRPESSSTIIGTSQIAAWCICCKTLTPPVHVTARA